MIAKPKVSIANVAELFADEIGQLWSPAAVTMSWPSAAGLQGPSVTTNVIAPARADMTIKVRAAHLQAARDVLSAALLSIEEPIATDRSSTKKLRRV